MVYRPPYVYYFIWIRPNTLLNMVWLAFLANLNLKTFVLKTQVNYCYLIHLQNKLYIKLFLFSHWNTDFGFSHDATQYKSWFVTTNPKKSLQMHILPKCLHIQHFAIWTRINCLYGILWRFWLIKTKVHVLKQ